MWRRSRPSTGASLQSLPPLRAPKQTTWWTGTTSRHHLQNYLIDDLIKAHKNYDYKFHWRRWKPTTTPSASYYYQPLHMEKETTLRVRRTTEHDQTHRMWAPLHATTERPDAAKTYYIILEKNYRVGRLLAGTTSSCQTGRLHLHVSTNIYIFSNNLYKLSTTLCRWLLQRCLLLLLSQSMSHYTLLHSTSTQKWYYSATYYTPTGSGSIYYLELENHSDSLRNMNGFATPTVIITGCNYNYIVQMLTPHYFERHLVDTTVIHGDLHADTHIATWSTCYKRHGYEVHPKGEPRRTCTCYRMRLQQSEGGTLLHLLRRRKVWGLLPSHPTTTWRLWWSMWRGCDYYPYYSMEALQWRVRQATYRLITQECYYHWPDYCLRLEDTTSTGAFTTTSVAAYYNGATRFKGRRVEPTTYLLRGGVKLQTATPGGYYKANMERPRLAQGKWNGRSKGPATTTTTMTPCQREKKRTERQGQGDNYDRSCYYYGMSSYVFRGTIITTVWRRKRDWLQWQERWWLKEKGATTTLRLGWLKRPLTHARQDYRGGSTRR